MAMVDPISQTRSDKQYFGAERVKQGRHESKRGIGEYICIYLHMNFFANSLTVKIYAAYCVQ